jgi:predicted Zn finger-like uncharacterized protein
MRLVCPNCEAKYEVPEDAIPETGRDVQCANCGHAWYQMRARAAGAETAAVAVAPAVAAPPAAPDPVIEAPTATAVRAPDPEPEAVPAEPEPEPAPVAEAASDEVGEAAVALAEDQTMEDPVAEAEAVPTTGGGVEEQPVAVADDLAAGAAKAEPEYVGAAEATDLDPIADAPVAEATVADAVTAEAGDAASEDDAVDPDAPEADATEPSPSADLAAPVAAYAVDESVLAILREEAEREAQARRTDAGKPLETQTDLGIDSAMPAAKKAELAGAASEPEGEDRLSGRRTILPDVEEINSTLRPTDVPQDDSVAAEAMAPVAEGRSSFRSGFLLVLTVAILGAALYGSADAIAQAVPSLAGPLKAYVSFVDSLRLQLDGLMQSATVAINGDGA